MKKAFLLLLAAVLAGCSKQTVSIPSANQGGHYEVRVSKRQYIQQDTTMKQE